nr:oxygen-independent coproporphyrinogen III oxidase [Pseudovibrio stylochi]
MVNLKEKYASRTIPRYTSYPTAPHFTNEVDGQVYEDWLQQLNVLEPLSLYLHVPFCQEMCHYCGCNTKATKQIAPIRAYGDLLLKEVHLIGGKLKQAADGKRQVQHIHWGGGTPSLLPRDIFLNVIDALKEYFDFLPDIEHAIELDPRTVTPFLAETLVMGGINRTSLGVQDFDLEVQKAIGRVQPLKVVETAVQALRDVGLSQINFDLMYGLPLQTEETIRQTVEYTKQLAPGRVALFGYAHVPWFKKHQQLIKEEHLPDAEARIMLSDVSREALIEAGYEAIGLDHFALPSDEMAIALKEHRLRRNFQGYTTDQADTLIGFGPSSIGFLPSGYIQNSPDMRGWARQVEEGTAPIVKGVGVHGEDKLRSQIIMELMTYYAVDVFDICAQHGQSPEIVADGFERLQEMVEDGLAVIREGHIELIGEGRRYVRVAAAAFDAYLPKQAARHSVAV